MVVAKRASDLSSVHEVAQSPSLRDKVWGFIAIEEIHRNLTSLAGSHFSFGRSGIDLADHPVVRAADVLNLHWITGFLSPNGLRRLQALGKPMVWTLHDQRSFTGGCHYTAGCTGFETDCAGCPQLRENPYDFPAAALADQIAAIDATRFTVVTPSRWLADCARRSRVFRDAAVQVIPYGLETDVFTPIDRAKARAALDLPLDGLHILFGADNPNEKRKGFLPLMEAFRHCAADAGFAQRLQDGAITFVSFGPSDVVAQFPDLRIRSLGYVHGDARMALAYAAADLFALPSLEDNLPNTLLEALGCGTPSLAFNIGGVPDAITDGETGRVVMQIGDPVMLARTILTLTADPRTLAAMRGTCRLEAERRFQLAHQASAYAALYASLPKLGPRSERPASSGLEHLFPRLLARSLRSVPRRIGGKMRRFLSPQAQHS
jgi:glycosyltransferase involved in cell wall biosynthesis